MELLADLNLLKKSKEEVSADEALGEKEFIGFYFASQQNEAAREFTPTLVERYDDAIYKLLTSPASLGIVYVPNDETEEDMFEFMNDFHEDWVAIPVGSPAIEEIKEKYKVNCIPHIVVVKKEDGSVVSFGTSCCIEARGYKAFEEWCQ